MRAMPTTMTFDELLDAAEALSLDEQADLVDVLQRRLAEQGRQQIADDVREARAEFERGGLRPMSVDDIMREIDR